MYKWVLQDIPWGTRYENVKYSKTHKVSFYEGTSLPKELKEYRAKEFSYYSWVEKTINNTNKNIIIQSKTLFTPREHQKQGAGAIYKAYSQGWSGMLLADKTGLGKTLTALVGICCIAKKQGKNKNNKGKLLVVCPKSVIPVWRQTIKSYPMSQTLLDPIIINYQSLQKLISEPKSVSKAKKRKTKNKIIAKKGVPKIDFDYCIFDEAHYTKNYQSSTVSLIASNIAKLETKYVKDKLPFCVFSTATPGSTPLNFSLMSGFMGKLLGKDWVAPSQFGQLLCDIGFHVSLTKLGWKWVNIAWFGSLAQDKNSEEFEKKKQEILCSQKEDTMRIGKALLLPNAPFIKRSPTDIANWPEQQLIPLPIELDNATRPIYEQAWTRFRQWLKLHPKGGDPKESLVETLRYRQKSSFLKTQTIVDTIVECLDRGEQVFVSCEFIETVDKIRQDLLTKGIDSVEISGRTDNREEERIKFQKGQVKVVVCTIVEGISFHANEILPDGSKATSNIRTTLLVDIRQNPLNTIQILGRCHRDGQNSITYIPFFLDTVDEQVVASFVNKNMNMNTMLNSQDNEFLDDTYRQYL